MRGVWSARIGLRSNGAALVGARGFDELVGLGLFDIVLASVGIGLFAKVPGFKSQVGVARALGVALFLLG